MLRIPELDYLATSNIGLLPAPSPKALRHAAVQKSPELTVHIIGPDSGEFPIDIEPRSVGEGGRLEGAYQWQFVAGCGVPTSLILGGRIDGVYTCVNYELHPTPDTMPWDLDWQHVPFTEYLVRRLQATGRERIDSAELKAWREELDRQFWASIQSGKSDPPKPAGLVPLLKSFAAGVLEKKA